MGAAASALPSPNAMAMAAAPPPPPPAPPVPLADLHPDLQRLILGRIPCSADLGRMSLVCRAWRDMMAAHRNQLCPPLPLPLLLLPAEPFGVRAACVTSGGCVHHTLGITQPHARFFGSHDGAWLFLATLQPHAHVALNTRSWDTRDTPTELLRRTDLEPHVVHGMVIHAAALTTSPAEATCVGAAIVTSWPLLPPAGAADTLPPRRRRCIAVLTRGEHLRLCNAILHGEDELDTQWKTICFRPSDRIYDPSVRARYLVRSAGKLLMVVRFTPYRNEPTSSFLVFEEKKRVEQQDSDDDHHFPVAHYPYAWIKMESLDGRVLFVAHGCSRSYRADKYPGFQEGIYFLDDGEYFDDAVIFAKLKSYPCNDNGKWSEDHVERCFPP